MKTNSLKIIIGQFASGEYYFPRPQITDEIWKKLESGSNLLLVAPRRVGKTSILNYLMDKPKENYIVIYYTSESVNSENEFYKKLYNHLIEKLKTSIRYKAAAFRLTKELFSKIEFAGPDGIKIGESKINYLDEFNNLIKSIKWNDEKFLILIDEFAQTVENIIQDADINAAVHFLETKREIRQKKEIQNRMQFIYAGSIGLENIVSKINSINTINDLAPVKITPLTPEEAWQLLQNIFKNDKVPVSSEVYEHLIKAIEWLIPFYFHLIIDEAYKIMLDENQSEISAETIDKAINNALKNRIYFDQWLTRLRKAYQGNEFTFAKELLNSISKTQTKTALEIIDLAVKCGVSETYKEILNALIHDGYINNDDDLKIYRFNSPLLRKWWETNVAD